MRKILALTALFGALQLVGATVAYGAPPACDLRENFLRQAAGRFQEAPAYAGVMADGRLFEVWATEDGSTWTAFVTQKDESGAAVSCVATAGDNWRSVEAAPRGTEL
jgi:hypothetical protein